jgi:hypothetical protein
MSWTLLSLKADVAFLPRMIAAAQAVCTNEILHNGLGDIWHIGAEKLLALNVGNAQSRGQRLG